MPRAKLPSSAFRFPRQSRQQKGHARPTQPHRHLHWAFSRADDAMAILAAFNSPDVDIIGMTTIFGNVRTPQATANALVLRELAKREDVSGMNTCSRRMSCTAQHDGCVDCVCQWDGRRKHGAVDHCNQRCMRMRVALQSTFFSSHSAGDVGAGFPDDAAGVGQAACRRPCPRHHDHRC